MTTKAYNPNNVSIEIDGKKLEGFSGTSHVSKPPNLELSFTMKSGAVITGKFYADTGEMYEELVSIMSKEK